MLTRRIIGKILVNRTLAIQSKAFKQYLPLGRPEIIAEALDEWGVDEILLVDRAARKENVCVETGLIKSIVEHCRAPLTACGGISTIDDAINVVKSGADRIAINGALLDDLSIVPKLVDVLGKQAIVGAIDFIQKNGKYYVYDYRTKQCPEELIAWCCRLECNGVGELFVHSVERDGAGTGYEEHAYQLIKEHVSIPVIASGGYGKPSHVKNILAAAVEAIAIGNSLNYIEHSVSTIKSALNRADLRKAGIQYSKGLIDENGRLLKQNDHELEENSTRKGRLNGYKCL